MPCLGIECASLKQNKGKSKFVPIFYNNISDIYLDNENISVFDLIMDSDPDYLPESEIDDSSMDEDDKKNENEKLEIILRSQIEMTEKIRSINESINQKYCHECIFYILFTVFFSLLLNYLFIELDKKV